MEANTKVTVDRPFVSTTTPTIDRANRLMGLTSHPGWNDLVAISINTVKVAEAAVVMFEGWDKDELAARSIAFRAAKRSHDILLASVASAIQTGVQEAAESLARSAEALPNDRNATDLADDLRSAVLRQVEETSQETRIPGSF